MRKSVPLFALFLLLFFPCHSQDILITGKVVNSNLDPVKSVRVELKSNPDLYCYTEENGEFNLSNQLTSIRPVTRPNEYLRQLPDGSVELYLDQKNLSVSFIDIQGRILETISRKDLDGIYQLSPQAYLSDLPEGMYIVRIQIGEQYFGFKYASTHSAGYSKGIQRLSGLKQRQNPAIKSAPASDDSLIFTSAFYPKARTVITQMEGDVGTIQLEDFGGYTLAENAEPDAAILYKDQGTFLSLDGKDGATYTLSFNPLVGSDEKIPLAAIPVEDFDFLPSSFSLTSGLHLEPSGTQFSMPVAVKIELYYQAPPDNLVVFLHDRETDETLILPYRVHNDFGIYSLSFHISHFSDIGYGEAGDLAAWLEDIPEDLPEAFENSDEAMGFISGRMLTYQDVSEAAFELWYESVIKPELESINDLASLENALKEFTLLAEYAQHINTDVESFSFFDEAKALLEAAMQKIMDAVNMECTSQTDICLKREMAKIGNQVVAISQKVPWIAEIDESEICENITIELVEKIEFSDYYIEMNVGTNKEVVYRMMNRNGEEITDQEVLEEISWVSNDPETVSVSQYGVLHALKVGTTTIVAYHCDVGEELIVVVELDPVPCIFKALDKKGTYEGKLSFKHYEKAYNGVQPIFIDKSYYNLSLHFDIDPVSESQYTSECNLFGVLGFYDELDGWDFNEYANKCGWGKRPIICGYDEVLSLDCAASCLEFRYHPINNTVDIEFLIYETHYYFTIQLSEVH